MRRLLCCLLLLLSGLAVPAAAQDAPLVVDAGGGTVLRVESAPFRLVLAGADGREQVATVPGVEGPPVRVPGVDGPMPIEPLGPLGGFPALGFVVGTAPSVSYPLPIYTGNRLFGAETGVLVSLVEVVESTRVAGGVDPLPVGARWQPVRVAHEGSLVPSGAPLEGGQRVDVAVTLADIPLFTRLARSTARPAPAGPGPTGPGLPATGPALPVAAAGLVLLLGCAAVRRRPT